MNSSNNISSLSDLQERKKQIEAELDYSQQALVNSVTPTSNSAQTFLVQDVLVPVIGVGAVLFLASRIYAKSKKRTVKNHAATIEENAGRTSVVGPETTRAYEPTEKRIADERTSGNRFSSVVKLGSILIPAAQAIMTAVQENKANTNRYTGN